MTVPKALSPEPTAGYSRELDLCPYGCSATATFGVAPSDHRSYFGGYVDHQRVRHDPMVHADDCPVFNFPEWE